MTPEAERNLRRARRLLRSYPRAWRVRYGEEFEELLLAEFGERQQSWTRSADVVGAGLRARLQTAGLTGASLDPSDQLRSSLAVVTGALAAFGTFGAGIWSQLMIGWQWSQPDGVAVHVAMFAMSAATLVVASLGVLAAVPLACSAARSAVRGRAGALLRPGLLVVLGAGALVVGSSHFAAGWPGTGGHPWSLRGLVPSGVAAFCWAATLAITSYWVHPRALASFPTAELVWMATSPLAMLCLVVGMTKAVRRLELSARALRFEATLAGAAIAAMAVFLGGAECWVLSGVRGPRGLFRVGTIDVLDVVVMTTALLIAGCAVRRARRVAMA